MIPAGSRDTLFANAVQQACAAVLLLVLPNILTSADFAQIVYVSVLLSALGVADFGLSLVYGRVVPSLVARGDESAVGRWDATVLSAGFAAAAVFSLAIVLLYLLRYPSVLGGLLLLPIPLLAFVAGFHVARASARGDFREYRAAIVTRSLVSLSTVPLGWWAGAAGWLGGYGLSVLTIAMRATRRSLVRLRNFDLTILRDHWLEGILLSLVSVTWLQLINFARLFASTRYPDDVLASYGVAAAVYQSVASLGISAFLPITVDILRRFGLSAADGAAHVTWILKRYSLLGLAGGIVTAEAAPLILPVLFRGYSVEPLIVFALTGGVVFFPFVICWGVSLVGMRRPGAYLLTIILALGIGWAVATMVDGQFRPAGAALGQLIVLSVFPALLLVPVLFFASADMRRALLGGIKLYAAVLGLTLAYCAIRWS